MSDKFKLGDKVYVSTMPSHIFTVVAVRSEDFAQLGRYEVKCPWADLTFMVHEYEMTFSEV